MGAMLCRHALLVFFVLAFALSWWTWPFVLLNPRSAPLLHFGVLFAALITTALVGGMAAIRELLAQIVRWRVRPWWYAVALGLPIVLIAVAAFGAVLLGGQLSTTSILEGLIVLPVGVIATALAAGPLSEEPGWRGVALPRLIERFGAVTASVVLGVIWAFWHLPVLLTDETHQREPVPYFVTLTALSVVITWAYLSSGRSLLIAILLHSMFNTIGSVVFPAFDRPDWLLLWWLLAAAWVAVAFAVAVALNREVIDGRTATPPVRTIGP